MGQSQARCEEVELLSFADDLLSSRKVLINAVTGEVL
jgi:hypothetical protein